MKKEKAGADKIKRIKHLSKSQLKSERGWTDGMVKKFLSEPDDYAINPHYRSGPRIMLYNLERVLEVEQMNDVRKELDKAQSRRESRQAAARRGVITKLERALKYVQRVEVEIPVMSRATLLKKACDHYNDFHEYKHNERLRDDPFIEARPDSDSEFLERVCVNYLRHVCTEYEIVLSGLTGVTGKDEAYNMLRERIFAAIAAAYPFLENECRRQSGQSIPGH